jgi:hypothetical protein
MPRANTIHLNPPWTQLHDRHPVSPRLEPRPAVRSAAEKAVSRRRELTRLESAREIAFRDFTLCGRPYL